MSIRSIFLSFRKNTWPKSTSKGIIRFVSSHSVILQWFTSIRCTETFSLLHQGKQFSFAISAVHVKRTPSRKTFLKRTDQLFWLAQKTAHLFPCCRLFQAKSSDVTFYKGLQNDGAERDPAAENKQIARSSDISLLHDHTFLLITVAQISLLNDFWRWLSSGSKCTSRHLGR